MYVRRAPPSATTPTAYPVAEPTTHPVRPDPLVGAAFPGDGPLHTCSAAVLNSTTGNLILTAAHCLTGATEATFVAGHHNSDDDSDDADRWDVDAVYLDQR